MANEIRLRRNNIAGSITDNPLTAGATTINSPGFVDLPVVDTTNHLILILDPLEANGAAEVVRVTAHSAASAVVTVVRGAENSTPRDHPLGSTWFHGPVASDYTLSDVTSGTRPAVPYEGELIYETDTNKLMAYTGTDWVSRDAGGFLAYAQNTAGQSIGAGPTDYPLVTVTLTVPAGRRLKVSATVAQIAYTDTTTAHFVEIVKDGVGASRAIGFPQVSGFSSYHTFFLDTPTAGSHTYKMTVTRYAGAGNFVTSTDSHLPTFILVEDIGAA